MPFARAKSKGHAASALQLIPDVRRHWDGIMSWDVFVQELPIEAQSVAEIPDDFRPGTIGQRGEIIDAILGVFPEADFSEPSWGTIDQDGFSIEINLGAAEQVSSFALHVRGGGNAPDAIESLLKALRMRALDGHTGEIFSLDAAKKSFREWQGYRDEIAKT